MKNISAFIFIITISLKLFSCTTKNSNKSELDTIAFTEKEKNSIVKPSSENSEKFDSTVFYNNSESGIGGSFTSYYKNGRIKEIGQQAEINGCSMNDGEFRKYDNKGNLTAITFYKNYNSSSCHETNTDIRITEFHVNGKIKATKQIKTCYECDEYKIGDWKFYNEKGELDSTRVYEYKDRILVE